MKRILLILSFITLISMSYGQTNVYHKFLGQNSVWTGGYTGYQSPWCYKNIYSVYDSNSGWTMPVGDSIYYLLEQQTSFYPPYYSGPMAGICDFTGNSSGNNYDLPGYLREDTILRKVYFLPIDSINEKLLFDFSLNIGDTLKPYSTYSCLTPIIVTQIDSILVGGNFRKQWTVNNGGCLWDGKIIEGIGSLFGLLEPYSNFERWGFVDCYSVNSVTMFSQSPDCPVLITQVDKQIKVDNVTISPNPAKNSITISQTETTFVKYEIYSLNGKLVAESKINSILQKVDLTGYTEGMYIVKLIGAQKVEFKKIVVVE